MEQTLILAKPDALQRGLIGDIVSRFEHKGLKIVGIKMIEVGDDVLDEHYQHHKDKDFFTGLKKFMQSSPMVAMVWEGAEAIETVRLMVGETNSRRAQPGSIRGDYSMSGASNNIVHASDGADTAASEIKRFFKPDELFTYDKSEYLHIYSEEER